VPPLEPKKATRVPATHKVALVYVKRCEAGLANLRIVAVSFARARAVERQVVKAIAACSGSDQLNALVNKNRADSSVDEAYLGEIAVAYALGNYRKYVHAVATTRRGPANILGLAQEQMQAGKQRLDAALDELPLPA
jgi:hypothetical protein